MEAIHTKALTYRQYAKSLWQPMKSTRESQKMFAMVHRSETTIYSKNMLVSDATESYK